MRIVVSGRDQDGLRTLQAALYGGWKVESMVQGPGGFSALLSPSDEYDVERLSYQVGRLQSFGWLALPEDSPYLDARALVR